MKKTPPKSFYSTVQKISFHCDGVKILYCQAGPDNYTVSQTIFFSILVPFREEKSVQKAFNNKRTVTTRSPPVSVRFPADMYYRLKEQANKSLTETIVQQISLGWEKDDHGEIIRKVEQRILEVKKFQ